MGGWFRYKMRSEKNWHDFEAGDSWENVRFLLEKKFRLHDSGRSGRREFGYLEGYTYPGGDRLADRDPVEAGVSIVLVRRPWTNHASRMRPFVPAKYRDDNTAADATSAGRRDREEGRFRLRATSESDRIAELVSTPCRVYRDRVARRNQDRMSVHPSNLQDPSSTSTEPRDAEVPFSGYVCRYCGKTGDHFFRTCPRRTDKNFRPLYKRTLPSGMPLSKFRPAVTREEIDSSFTGPDGRPLVYREETEARTPLPTDTGRNRDRRDREKAAPKDPGPTDRSHRDGRRHGRGRDDPVCRKRKAARSSPLPKRKRSRVYRKRK